MVNRDGECDKVAELGENDFFGEMALLGDHIRKADVIADTSVTLLRIRCADIVSIAERYPRITERLNEAKAQRSA